MKVWQGNSYKGKGIGKYITVIIIPMEYNNKTQNCRVSKNGQQESFKIEAKGNNVKEICDMLKKFLEEK